MTCRSAVALALFALTLAAPGCGKGSKPAASPQTVRMDEDVLEQFLEQIDGYAKLHRRLTDKVPVAEPNWSDQQIADRQRLLTVAIQTARRDNKEGDIFTPEAAAAFRDVLGRELAGPGGAAMLGEIGEPGKSVPLELNAYHPDDATTLSIPPPLLLQLPALPDQVQYRFVGRHLVLRDTEASLILDILRDALPETSTPR